MPTHRGFGAYGEELSAASPVGALVASFVSPGIPWLRGIYSELDPQWTDLVKASLHISFRRDSICLARESQQIATIGCSSHPDGTRGIVHREYIYILGVTQHVLDQGFP
ncbi:hypothetical protein EV363DRAFT_1180222 [Boletus edulis]|nr:hypothetical protein EV363DRAFT_1180222 [Boletus edulis]